MTQHPGSAAPALPFTQVTCLTATCSGCGDEACDEDEGYTPHFGGADAARESLISNYEWQLVTGPGGQLQWQCRSCAEKATCARLGHDPRISPAAVLEDGSVIGEFSYCERCGTGLSHSPRTPPPPGYPAPAPATVWLRWDTAALPGGQALADAASTMITALSAAAVTARWDAWDGAQPRRPQHDPPSPAACSAAAQLLITAARQLLAQQAGPGVVPGIPGAGHDGLAPAGHRPGAHRTGGDRDE
ncbi:MAG TPA: hypothetical protein VGM53_35490 [Streptosporangiaceae bacterium]|jgi:hypothetical protein